MTALASFCREIYYGTTKRALRTRYTFLLFDLVVISYFVVTTFLPSSEWIVVADMSIGVVLLLDFLGRLIADRNRGAFLIKPMTIVDLVVIASLFIPALVGSFAFLRLVRTLRLMRSYAIVRHLRGLSHFFARNEEIIFSALNLLVSNNAKGTLRLLGLKAPRVGDMRRGVLEDIAISCGARFVRKDAGDDVKQVMVAASDELSSGDRTPRRNTLCTRRKAASRTGSLGWNWTQRGEFSACWTSGRRGRCSLPARPATTYSFSRTAPSARRPGTYTRPLKSASTPGMRGRPQRWWKRALYGRSSGSHDGTARAGSCRT